MVLYTFCKKEDDDGGGGDRVEFVLGAHDSGQKLRLRTQLFKSELLRAPIQVRNCVI